jgi:prolipoprotein diacylglyceryl transferase
VIASIPSPGASGIGVGPFEIHVYGLMYAVGLALAILITIRRWEARGGSRDLVYDVALWGFPAGLIGGRLYFDLTSANLVPPHWWGAFAIWDGGMGIWGGIALGSAVGIWRLRRAGVSPAPFLDAAAPALLVGQAVGRIGNYFNQELFGGPSSLPWALQISPAHRPLGYEAFASFHPTFLYELIWNLGLAAFLVWLGHHRRIRPPGLFALYVAGYSAFRIFEESLRVDPAHHIFGLRLNLYVAGALTVAGAIWFVASQRQSNSEKAKGSRRRAPTLLAVGWAAVALAGCSQAGFLSSAFSGDTRPTELQAEPAQPAVVHKVNNATRPVPAPRSTSPSSKDTGAIPPASAGTNGTKIPDLASARSRPLVAHSLAAVDSNGSGGPTTTLIDGIALAPPSAPEPIKGAIDAANSISRAPYIWGGGHGSWFARGYDCSGAVSFALFGGGFLTTPLASGQLESWGAPGPGRWLTVYASASHAYAVIAGLRWDTVGDARGSGPRWHPNKVPPQGFVARHYPGY